MKVAPIIDAIRAAQERGSSLRFRLIHTGQHYDRNMSGAFFEQLGIPELDINLEVGSGTQAEQTGAIMARYEKVLLERRSDLCVVVGDVTSTMACAIAAQKLGVKVAHVEAGIRSGDWSMPEEINRMVTDSISNYFFTTSGVANENLRQSGVGVGEDQIFFVGNTMIDTLLKQRPRFRPPPVWSEVSLREQNYFVLTLHRPVNVDNDKGLRELIDVILSETRGLPIIFPVHPRTARTIRRTGIAARSLHLTEPLSYLEFNHLVTYAKAVITDSGGVSEETTVLGIPCLTLRDSTERPETVTLGTNELIGSDPSQLRPALKRLFAGQWKLGQVPPLWDGRTAERIVMHIEQLL